MGLSSGRERLPEEVTFKLRLNVGLAKLWRGAAEAEGPGVRSSGGRVVAKETTCEKAGRAPGMRGT